MPANAFAAEQVLAFRLVRSGLAQRGAQTIAEAARCPASDFSRDAAFLALAARTEQLSREAYDDAVDRGDIVVAHAPRGAIHAHAPADVSLFGRALVSSDDEELGAQLGRQVQQLAAEEGFAPTEALAEVAEATVDALRDGRALGKNELHAELRERVRAELKPWCKGCKSYHVAPMLWRYATVVAGARLDSSRRYVLDEPEPPPDASAAVRRFLRFYGPATVSDFATWAGVARPHASRLWEAVADELDEVSVDGQTGWILREDVSELESPPQPRGVRLLPPGDPYLQPPNRKLLAPDEALRRRLFRPVASPGAVLADGKLAGLWRATAKGRKLEIGVETVGEIPRAALDDEVERLVRARGASGAVLSLT